MCDMDSFMLSLQNGEKCESEGTGYPIISILLFYAKKKILVIKLRKRFLNDMTNVCFTRDYIRYLIRIHIVSRYHDNFARLLRIRRNI